ncbi:protein prune homolog 2 [Bemisia tabaci]|uniref:protein prune homolog 2 n=1 Tax=Bemisia tabaci TaxID=7038 RepID=UPI003B28A874
MEAVKIEHCEVETKETSDVDPQLQNGRKPLPVNKELLLENEVKPVFAEDKSYLSNEIPDSGKTFNNTEGPKTGIVFHTPQNMSSVHKYNLSSLKYETALEHPLSETAEPLDLKDLDLELPSVETYKVEPVDFPNSPQELRQNFEASGVPMPQEIDSGGGTGFSEDDDHSMYQAVLSPDCQDVRLKREKPPPAVVSSGRRKIIPEPMKTGIMDDISLDSDLSDDDFDDQFLSPGLDSPDDIEDSILEQLDTSVFDKPEPIPELSAKEELEESRSWQYCTVGGVDRQIDMKVIEPYKRVLSHGGYMTVGSHNAMIVFSACFLPHRSRADYNYVMDNLFFYVLKTLDQLVTEDYVLIYLHGATARDCMPKFGWLKRCYQMIDRRLRKNLKNLYLVHPTFWLKTIVLMTKPFISSKFSKKIVFVNSLAELNEILPVLEQASIPDRVKQYDRIMLSMEGR